jgi:23S rRNA pseudouridine1911/1915/1917 synthase
MPTRARSIKRNESGRSPVILSAETIIRLDAFLTAAAEDYPTLRGTTRAQFKQWIMSGDVLVNEQPVHKAGVLLNCGDTITVTPPVRESHLKPYDYPLAVIYEDDDILVINKPPGISMHPGAGEKHRTVANAVISRLETTYVAATQHPHTTRPGIVHRLDKDTSGLVVIAKNIASHNALVKQFKEHSIRRLYLALAFTAPRRNDLFRQQQSGVIALPIGRDPRSRVKMAVVEGGKAATTHFKVLERMNYGTLLELSLESGRTHQIRVHLNHLGSPVVGDKQYGDFSAMPKLLKDRATQFGRQVLHAFRLSFIHPVSSKKLEFEVQPPDDFQALLEAFRTYTV